MKELATNPFLTFATVFYGQKTVQFADSIRKVYSIPDISYAAVDSKSKLEIVALGGHSIVLTDTAPLNERFHIGSNTKAMTAFILK